MINPIVFKPPDTPILPRSWASRIAKALVAILVGQTVAETLFILMELEWPPKGKWLVQ